MIVPSVVPGDVVLWGQVGLYRITKTMDGGEDGPIAYVVPLNGSPVPGGPIRILDARRIKTPVIK